MVPFINPILLLCFIYSVLIRRRETIKAALTKRNILNKAVIDVNKYQSKRYKDKLNKKRVILKKERNIT